MVIGYWLLVIGYWLLVNVKSILYSVFCILYSVFCILRKITPFQQYCNTLHNFPDIEDQHFIIHEIVKRHFA
jgi:hypothetical protein